MFLNLRHLQQAGDTMVEVLISMAIVSMILGGAYVTSNKSLLATRDAQEHVQALKLADAQLELLNSQPPLYSILSGGAFCYVQSAGPKISYSPQTVNNTNCSVESNGKIAPIGFQPTYAVTVNYDVNQLYTVKIMWDSVTGNGKGQLTMFYRTDK